ncbi:MAG: hypothetical protein H7Z18_04630 [Methylophilaceae bacterium]|nr:hypothetical protein [Methylophilaceae bacterium]
MILKPTYKNLHLIIAALAITFVFSNNSFAAEKDKSSRRAALIIQKIKQDMEAEKATMQKEFDAQKKELEAKLTESDEQAKKLNASLTTAKNKVAILQSDLKKTTDEKLATEDKLAKTQTILESTQKNLSELTQKYQQAQADLKVNDAQRKTLVANVSDTSKALAICTTKNAKLYDIGTELVKVYENPSTYQAAMRKESFFQLKRVELENAMQSYQDQLNDERVSVKQVVN